MRMEGTAMDRITTLTLTALVWAGTVVPVLAQQTNPAPPINERAPAGSNSTASNVAATDFNWVWLSLAVTLVALGLWYLARRRSARRPR